MLNEPKRYHSNVDLIFHVRENIPQIVNKCLEFCRQAFVRILNLYDLFMMNHYIIWYAQANRMPLKWTPNPFYSCLQALWRLWRDAFSCETCNVQRARAKVKGPIRVNEIENGRLYLVDCLKTMIFFLCAFCLLNTSQFIWSVHRKSKIMSKIYKVLISCASPV